MSENNGQLNKGGPTLTLDQIREKFGALNGRRYWQSLDELAQTEGFQEAIANEFPDLVTTADTVDRREFFRLMGASLALAGLTACTRQAPEKIIPYVKPPEEVVPGQPLFFATAMTLGGYAYGVLAESHMGRPTKLEGNPEHPASLGGTDVFAQASILSLYDPDRSQSVYQRGRVSTWETFLVALEGEMKKKQGTQGAGLRILTETVTSPTLAAQIAKLLEDYPKARWHQYEPLNRDPAYDGSLLAFREQVDTHYRFDKADVILSLDADFLSWGPGHVRYARDFASRRDVVDGPGHMNRLYAVQSSPSVTSAAADHALPLSPTEVENFARVVGKALGLAVPEAATTVPTDWVEAVAEDLKSHKGRSIVVAGEQQNPAVHALAHAMNAKLGNTGKTVIHTEPVAAQPLNQAQSMAELTADMKAGNVSLLIVIGGNPVYNAPADLDFTGAMDAVRMRIRLGLYEDETSALCHWHVPAAHYLEAWSDARAYDGTASIVQPLIEPLYNGKSAHEMLAAMSGKPSASGYDLVRAYWEGANEDEAFEASWRKAVHDGVVPNTAAKVMKPTLRTGLKSELRIPETEGDLQIVFRPDPSTWDGSFANNGWLQELPRPVSMLVWDNAILVSPATAKALEVENGHVLVLGSGERTVQGPVWVTPGHADGCVTVSLGYGRERAGRVGDGVGFNAYPIRTSSAAWTAPGFTFETHKRHALVTTQKHHRLDGREHVHAATLEQYEHNQDFLREHTGKHGKPPSIYPPFDYSKGPQWGMVIDLGRCIGCNACVMACQSENSIPVVGKDQVSRGREMQWIRIDRYYEGDEANPSTHHQPMACVHCENAPCEAVCPVAATVHSRDGLNQMVYNRCVGTRYCSNNCPYKVRRFNFYKYSDDKTPSLKLGRNPDVTVRPRGVMEKCTYCVQRISGARIEAKKAGKPIPDGACETACQQACPTRAIVFGDITDEKSEVTRHRASPLNYSVLGELATQPRTTYLARVRNLNPKLAGEHDAHGEHGHA